MKKVWNGKLGFIEADPDRPIKALGGSLLVNREQDAVVAEVRAGTIVSIIDRPLTVQGKTWYPIEPLSHEVRYLHKSQLGFGSAENKIITTPSAADEIMALKHRIEDLEKRIKQLEKRKKKKQP